MLSRVWKAAVKGRESGFPQIQDHLVYGQTTKNGAWF